MTTEIQLLQDGRLVFIKISDTVPVNEITQYYDAIYAACDRESSPVCAIFDIDSSTRLPPNAITVAVRHPRNPFKHRNFGLGVAVSASDFLRGMTSIAVKVARLGNFQTSASMDEAMQKVEAFLAKQDSREK
jgi:hypothetical protein